MIDLEQLRIEVGPYAITSPPTSTAFRTMQALDELERLRRVTKQIDAVLGYCDEVTTETDTENHWGEYGRGLRSATSTIRRLLTEGVDV